MTSSAVAAGSRYDPKTIVVGGIRVGAATGAGVAVFALLSRYLSGTPEALVQSLIVLLGGALVTYWPAALVRPRDVDTIGWTCLLGSVGAVAFTIVDIALLRPLHTYDWTWDAIGGGSGFWYISIWGMGATFLAWMGAWRYAIAAGRGRATGLVALSAQPLVLALALFLALAVSTGRVRPGYAALTYAIAAIVAVPVAAWSGTRR